MHKGQPLSEVAQQITRDRNHKKDYLANTRSLRMDGKGSLIFDLDGEQVFTPTKICLEQIGERTGIPRKYAEKMAEEAPELLATNINHWFNAHPEKRMLRTIRNGTNTARAFLSDRYRPLDNADIAERILPRMSDLGLTIESAAITDTRLYLQAVSPKMEATIKKVGDIVQSGVVVSNSEVGKGSLSIRHLVKTLRCTNGMIAEQVVKQHHVGGRGVEDEGSEYFSDETKQANDRAFWLKTGDLVTHTLSKERFDAIISRLNETTEVELNSPIKVVELMAERFVWQENEKESVLTHLCNGGDLTQYGLLNAVTRTAQDIESYDRAIEFEKQGGDIMQLRPTDFRTL